jgi:polysaccharide export outer membrane protein
MWSFSPRLPGNGAAPTALGTFTVAPDGTVVLPYAGSVHLDGLTLDQTERKITDRLTQLGMFQQPSVTIELTAMPQGQVLVTGAIGEPKAIVWPNQGLTLADAISQSLGNGTAVLGQEDNSSDHAIAKVSVLRGSAPSAELPVSIALEREIPLRPGDRVVIRKSPAVRVTVLGPGMQTSGVIDFEHRPTLSEVLARSSGLNPNAANGHAVFVLRERPGAKPQLFDFAWNKGEGVVAAHRFAMQSADLVYVAEAPIVSVQRVINILFQAAVPAQFVK